MRFFMQPSRQPSVPPSIPPHPSGLMAHFSSSDTREAPDLARPAQTALRRARASIGADRFARHAGEGPAVLRLRMLELAHALKMGAIDVEARDEADAALAALREAVLSRPSITFADAEARARTLDLRR